MISASKPLMALPYVIEVERQCEIALAEAAAMREAEGHFWPIADPLSAIGDFFDHAQRFCCSVGIIAKILYAQDEKRQQRADRARELRGILGLTDKPALANSAARNAFEHVDERIDAWVEANQNARTYAHCGISRMGQTIAALRRYDSDEDTLTLGNAQISVEPLVRAVKEVQEAVVVYRKRTEASPT